MKNKYDCRAAMLAVVMAIAADEKAAPDVKALLAEHTDIPADKLDFAAKEMGSTLFGLRQVVSFYKAAVAEEELQGALTDLVQGATWIDDDKRDLTLNVSVVDDEGAVATTVKVETKLPTETDEA